MDWNEGVLVEDSRKKKEMKINHGLPYIEKNILFTILYAKNM